MIQKVSYSNGEGLEIMVSAEGQINNKHSFYYPSVILILVRKGKLHLELESKTITIDKGKFVLIDRCVFGFMYKSWTKDEGEANISVFVFHQQFIEKVKQHFDKGNNDLNRIEQSIFVLRPNVILTGLFDSVESYLNDGEDLDEDLVELKTLEAMMGVLNYHPECYPIFLQELVTEKIDLQLLAENNYMFNIPLAKLAAMSGRSLSTFSRDFKAIFKESPHRWIRKRRLLEAKNLLLNTNQKPSEFYLNLGFESLAHFSRVFKKEFGITMTDFRKNNQSRII